MHLFDSGSVMHFSDKHSFLSFFLYSSLPTLPIRPRAHRGHAPSLLTHTRLTKVNSLPPEKLNPEGVEMCHFPSYVFTLSSFVLFVFPPSCFLLVAFLCQQPPTPSPPPPPPPPHLPGGSFTSTLAPPSRARLRCDSGFHQIHSSV